MEVDYCPDGIDGFGPSVITTGLHKMHREQLLGGCYTPYQNSFCLLLCSSHISNPYHMVTFSQLLVILMNQDSGFMGS